MAGIIRLEYIYLYLFHLQLVGQTNFFPCLYGSEAASCRQSYNKINIFLERNILITYTSSLTERYRSGFLADRRPTKSGEMAVEFPPIADSI